MNEARCQLSDRISIGFPDIRIKTEDIWRENGTRESTFRSSADLHGVGSRRKPATGEPELAKISVNHFGAESGWGGEA